MSIYKKIANIQDQILNIPKDGKNPHFSNTYATYEQVMEVLHPLLRKENLMICHSFENMSKDMCIPVTTHLVDLEDDKKISSTIDIPMTKNDPQMAGSAITYAKRYTVLAMLGLGTEDDDGERATSSPKVTTAPKQAESYDATENALCAIHSNPDGSAVSLKHFEKNGKEWWSHPTAKGGWCTGTDTKYNREA